MQLAELTKYLSEYLNLREFPATGDVSQNGLQVDATLSYDKDETLHHLDDISCISTAVDACMESFEKAHLMNANLLLVHHGLFWGKSLTITGMHGQRIAYLLQNHLSLYAMHLPLDIHPEIGNNILLARKLELEVVSPFGNYNGLAVGLETKAQSPLQWKKLIKQVSTKLSCSPEVFHFGNDLVERIAIVSGSGASEINTAAAKHIDVLITGEMGHSSYHQARDLGLNIILAGHYATETLGIRALGEHLQQKFGLQHAFLDVPTGL